MHGKVIVLVMLVGGGSAVHGVGLPRSLSSPGSILATQKNIPQANVSNPRTVYLVEDATTQSKQGMPEKTVAKRPETQPKFYQPLQSRGSEGTEAMKALLKEISEKHPEILEEVYKNRQEVAATKIQSVRRGAAVRKTLAEAKKAAKEEAAVAAKAKEEAALQQKKNEVVSAMINQGYPSKDIASILNYSAKDPRILNFDPSERNALEAMVLIVRNKTKEENETNNSEDEAFPVIRKAVAAAKNDYEKIADPTKTQDDSALSKLNRDDTIARLFGSKEAPERPGVQSKTTSQPKLKPQLVPEPEQPKKQEVAVEPGVVRQNLDDAENEQALKELEAGYEKMLKKQQATADEVVPAPAGNSTKSLVRVVPRTTNPNKDMWTLK
ncbi:MAG: hypothetical protein WCT20_00315 [Candidatus Babeliales bacterium]